MGPVVGIGVLVYQQMTGKPLPWGLFFALVFAGLALHFYRELEKVKKSDLALPEMYLQYDANYTGLDYSGLFLRTQNGREACAVEMSSEVVVGENHRRMGMLWSIPEGQVGRDPVPVRIKCFRYRHDTPCPYGGIPGDQLEMFLNKKASKPEELIVTIRFKDVNGHYCPVKRFRIFRYTDKTAVSQTIRCEPVDAFIEQFGQSLVA